MRLFAFLLNKTSPLTPEQKVQSQAAGEATLPWVTSTYESATWQSGSGRGQLMLWSNDPAGIADELIVEEGPHAFVRSGYWHSSAYRDDRQLMQALLNASDPRTIISRLAGSYVLCLYDGRTDTVKVWNTPSAQPSFFYQDRGPFCAGGMRGVHVHFLGRQSTRPTYNPQGIAGLIVNNYTLGTSIAYEDTHLLESNRELTASTNGISLTEIDDTMSTYGLGCEEPASQDYDEMAQVLVNAANYFKSLNVPLTLGLSGGKDSRLVLAALHQAGVSFQASTTGWANHPDVLVAKMLAERLDIPHTCNINEAKMDDLAPVTVNRILLRHLFLQDCLFISSITRPSVVTNSTSRKPVSSINLAGTGGEFIRGGSAIRSRSGMLGQSKMTCEASENIVRRGWSGNLEYIQEKLVSHFQDWIENWIRQNRHENVPEAILERLYIHGWANRGYGAVTQNADVGGGFSIVVDGALVKAAHRFRGHYRQDEIISWELIKRLAPQILDIPLCEERWSFEVDGPLPGDEAGYAKRAPLKIDYSDCTGNYTYLTGGADLKPVLEENLLHAPASSPIFDIVKRVAVNDILTTRKIFSPKPLVLLWRLQGANLIFSNNWLRYQDYQEEPVLVRHKIPWHKIHHKVLDAVDDSFNTAKEFANSRNLHNLKSNKLNWNKNLLALKQNPYPEDSELTRVVVPDLDEGIPKFPDSEQLRHYDAIGNVGTARCTTDVTLRLSYRETQENTFSGNRPILYIQLEKHQLTETQKYATGAWIALDVGKVKELRGCGIEINFAARSQTGILGSLSVSAAWNSKKETNYLKTIYIDFNKNWKKHTISVFVPQDLELEANAENAPLTVLIPLGSSPGELEIGNLTYVVHGAGQENAGTGKKRSVKQIAGQYLRINHLLIDQLQSLLENIQEEFDVPHQEWEEFLNAFQITVNPSRKVTFSDLINSRNTLSEYLSGSWVPAGNTIHSTLGKLLKNLSHRREIEQEAFCMVPSSILAFCMLIRQSVYDRFGMKLDSSTTADCKKPVAA